MRLEDSGQIWLPGRTAGAWAPPAEFEARAIRPVHRVRPVEAAYRAECLRYWRCPGPVPYWEHLRIDNALVPPVYPVPYWSLLRADRLENDAAQRSARAAVPIPGPPQPGRPESTREAERTAPERSERDEGSSTNDDERPLYAMARIGDLPPHARASLARRVETAYEVQRFAAAGNLVDLVI